MHFWHVGLPLKQQVKNKVEYWFNFLFTSNPKHLFYITYVPNSEKKHIFEIDNTCTFVGLNFSCYLNRQLICPVASQKQDMFMCLLGNEARTQWNIVQGCIGLYNSPNLSHTCLCLGIKTGLSGQRKGCRAKPHFKTVLFL